MKNYKESEDKPAFIEKTGCCQDVAVHSCAIETGESLDLQEELLEESFFLMYHLHLQPSEIDAMPVFNRKWIVQRFIHQKKVEKEIMEQMRRGSGIPPEFLKEIERTKNG